MNFTLVTKYMTKNPCYIAGRKINPQGIVKHSTGANNKKLSRYINDPERLGKNLYNNHWDQNVDKCVHAFIGEDKNGNVIVYQILPWDYRPWGCGSGSKGSYNNSHIQYEICEDALSDKAYYEKAFAVARELDAYLCEKFNLPVSSIVSHQEAYKKGYASNHGDCDHWLRKFGDSMDNQRKVVDEILKSKKTPSTPTPTPSTGVATLEQAKKYVGTRVKELQDKLIYLGYKCGTGVADGSFGNGTYNSVLQFQKDNGLKVDAYFGTQSWAKLDALYNAKVNKKKVEDEANSVLSLLKNYKKLPTKADIVAIQKLCNYYGLKGKNGRALAEDGSPGANTTHAVQKLPVLKEGSKGEAVKYIQRRMGINADGSFGPTTKKHFLLWQEANGLSKDGACGPNSWLSFIK